MIEQHPITDRASWLKLRERDITASVAGALLGVHEYQTPFGLWALKTGRAPEEAAETGPMRRGRLLEPVALTLINEERPAWGIVPGNAYYRDPMDRLGATPDAFARDPERGLGVVQIKTVEPSIFRRKWRDPETGDVDLPLWIAVQAITEAHLTGAKWACVAAVMVSHGLELEIVDVPIHAGVVSRLREAVHDFWGLVESGREPPPDFARDGYLIEHLFRDASGEEIDLSGDNELPELLDKRARLTAEKAAAEKELREIKAKLLFKLGTAAAGRCADGRLVTAKTVHRKPYSVEATSYRDVRVKGEPA